jgi:Cd2+/Zn2+-exporting ATPase
MFSLLLLASGMAMSLCDVTFFRQPLVALAWYMVAYLPVGLPVMKEGWESIHEGDYFSEFTLMVIATLGAFCIGEYPEGVAVMLFYSVGELFEDKAVDRAKRDIGALLDVRPERASLVVGELTFDVSPQSVEVGQTIEVKVGGRVPLDGTLLTGQAAFDTAALTGESVPRTIGQGEDVLAGMIAADKVVRLRVTRPFAESALSRILELVRGASERKAPAELFVRRFARVYTPVVIVLAVLIVLLPWAWSSLSASFAFVFSDWFYRALVFLVISCPCALVISIPLGYFGGIGAASRRGILFKGGNYLDAITKVNTVVFDKTGTLTRGTFEVRECVCAPGITEAELLRVVASAEAGSTHPIAKAIDAYARRKGTKLATIANVREQAGLGLEVELDGKPALVGNARLLAGRGVAYPGELDEMADTIVACAVGGVYAGYLRLSDTLKPDARAAIDQLKALKIDNISILSGDKQGIVTAFADELGVERAYGDLLPEGKVKRLEELRGDPTRRVAFVGDGMNDAPVLALSHVGIAMGGLGSDAAIETADVVIQTDQPSKVAEAIRVGRATRRVVWQNISMAFAVKFVVLLLGAGGVATLWEAVFADVGVALLAILNAMRVGRLVK